MFSKKIFALFVITALVLAVAVKAQEESSLNQKLVGVGADLTKIIRSIGTILANPTALLRGQLGGKVPELVNRVVELVGDLTTTVDNLLKALGLAK